MVKPQILLCDLDEVLPSEASEDQDASKAPDVGAIGVPPVIPCPVIPCHPDLNKFNISVMEQTDLWSHVGCSATDGLSVDTLLQLKGLDQAEVGY